jgi:hypothetical protein
MTPIQGYAQFKSVSEAVKIRTIHRWSGRIALALILINSNIRAFAGGYNMKTFNMIYKHQKTIKFIKYEAGIVGY